MKKYLLIMLLLISLTSCGWEDTVTKKDTTKKNVEVRKNLTKDELVVKDDVVLSYSGEAVKDDSDFKIIKVKIEDVKSEDIPDNITAFLKWNGVTTLEYWDRKIPGQEFKWFWLSKEDESKIGFNLLGSALSEKKSFIYDTMYEVELDKSYNISDIKYSRWYLIQKMWGKPTKEQIAFLMKDDNLKIKKDNELFKTIWQPVVVLTSLKK